MKKNIFKDDLRLILHYEDFHSQGQRHQNANLTYDSLRAHSSFEIPLQFVIFVFRCEWMKIIKYKNKDNENKERWKHIMKKRICKIYTQFN